MLRPCVMKDAQQIYLVVNDAARAYEGVIPPDCYHQPYMPWQELLAEMERISFLGWEEGRELVAVMGMERVEDVTLLRHAYVAPTWQRKGIGTELLRALLKKTETARLLVGTWADAWWALDFYRKHGFRLLADKDDLLRRYWRIPDRQREASVVLGLDVGRPQGLP